MDIIEFWIIIKSIVAISFSVILLLIAYLVFESIRILRSIRLMIERLEFLTNVRNWFSMITDVRTLFGK